MDSHYNLLAANNQSSSHITLNPGDNFLSPERPLRDEDDTYLGQLDGNGRGDLARSELYGNSYHEMYPAPPRNNERMAEVPILWDMPRVPVDSNGPAPVQPLHFENRVNGFPVQRRFNPYKAAEEPRSLKTMKTSDGSRVVPRTNIPGKALEMVLVFRNPEEEQPFQAPGDQTIESLSQNVGELVPAEMKVPSRRFLARKRAEIREKELNDGYAHALTLPLVTPQGVIDTVNLSRRIHLELKMRRISQALFAKRVLKKTQSFLSTLLLDPKPWENLKMSQEYYECLYEWLMMSWEDQEAVLNGTKVGRIQQVAAVLPVTSQFPPPATPGTKFNFTEHQKDVLSMMREQCEAPNAAQIKQAAKELGVEEKKVQTFFANARRRDPRNRFNPSSAGSC